MAGRSSLQTRRCCAPHTSALDSRERQQRHLLPESEKFRGTQDNTQDHVPALLVISFETSRQSLCLLESPCCHSRSPTLVWAQALFAQPRLTSTTPPRQRRAVNVW